MSLRSLAQNLAASAMKTAGDVPVACDYFDLQDPTMVAGQLVYAGTVHRTGVKVLFGGPSAELGDSEAPVRARSFGGGPAEQTTQSAIIAGNDLAGIAPRAGDLIRNGLEVWKIVAVKNPLAIGAIWQLALEPYVGEWIFG